MAKHHLLVDAESDTPRIDINWEFCILGQENVTGMQCPYSVKNKMIIWSGYRSIAEHLISFNELGSHYHH